MEKQLTAMQQLLKFSEYRREKSVNSSKTAWNMIIDKIKDEMIELEKQQIIDAAKWLPKPFESMEFLPELAEQYYNNNFKQ